MSADYVNCVECKAPIMRDAPTTYRRITAWEKKAPMYSSRRGGADIVLREHQDEFCCSTCVARLKRGVAPLQGALI